MHRVLEVAWFLAYILLVKTNPESFLIQLFEFILGMIWLGATDC